MTGYARLLCQLENTNGLVLYHMLEYEQVPLQHLKLPAHLLSQNGYHIPSIDKQILIGGAHL